MISTSYPKADVANEKNTVYCNYSIKFKFSDLLVLDTYDDNWNNICFYNFLFGVKI